MIHRLHAQDQDDAGGPIMPPTPVVPEMDYDAADEADDDGENDDDEDEDEDDK